MNAGIYIIRNDRTGEFYLGQSSRPKARWTQHRNRLRKGIHPIAEFQRSYDRDGERSFSLILLVACCHTTKRCRLEERLIDALRPAFNGPRPLINRRGVRYYDSTASPA